MKALFCTDGSNISFNAIKKTLIFLKKDFLIDIINVIDWGFFPSYVTFPHELEKGFEEYKNNAEKIIDKTIQEINAKGWQINEADYIEGHIAKTLLEKINLNNYDLVILGSHGKKGIKKWLGSTSRKIISKSHAPTMTVHPYKENESESNQINKKIVVAIDGSECSYNTIHTIVKLFDTNNLDIEFLNVKPGLELLPIEVTMDQEWIESYTKIQNEMSNEIMDNAKKILQTYNLKPSKEIIKEGNVTEEILKYLEENKRDFIAIGSHGREGLSELIIGSTSKRILDNFTGCILTVPLIKKMEI